MICLGHGCCVGWSSSRMYVLAVCKSWSNSSSRICASRPKLFSRCEWWSWSVFGTMASSYSVMLISRDERWCWHSTPWWILWRRRWNSLQLISGTLMEVIMILHFVNDSQKVMTAVSVVLPSKCCGGFYAISLRMFHFVSKCDCFSWWPNHYTSSNCLLSNF